MPDSPPLCGKHPARTARAADCSAPPERRGRTTTARWHRGSVAAASSPVLWREKQQSRCCARLHTYPRSEEHTSELQSRLHLVCRLLLEKKKTGSPWRKNRLCVSYVLVSDICRGLQM